MIKWTDWRHTRSKSKQNCAVIVIVTIKYIWHNPSCQGIILFRAFLCYVHPLLQFTVTLHFLALAEVCSLNLNFNLKCFTWCANSNFSHSDFEGSPELQHPVVASLRHWMDQIRILGESSSSYRVCQGGDPNQRQQFGKNHQSDDRKLRNFRSTPWTSGWMSCVLFLP